MAAADYVAKIRLGDEAYQIELATNTTDIGSDDIWIIIRKANLKIGDIPNLLAAARDRIMAKGIPLA